MQRTSLISFLPSFLLSCSKILVTCSRACLPASVLWRKKRLGLVATGPWTPPSLVDHALSPQNLQFLEQTQHKLFPISRLFLHLFFHRRLCVKIQVLLTSRMIIISRWSIPAQILFKKKKHQLRGEKWWRKKQKREERTKVQKVKLFFLFLFFLLLPFSIVFVAADNILKELSSLPFVFVCFFFFWVDVWVSNSAGQCLFSS